MRSVGFPVWEVSRVPVWGVSRVSASEVIRGSCQGCQ